MDKKLNTDTQSTVVFILLISSPKTGRN